MSAPEPTALSGIPQITFTDLAVISLTAVGVIVAVMAVIMGALAILGWASIKEAAASQARNIGKEAIDDHLKSDDFLAKLRDVASAEVEEQIREKITVTIAKPKGGRRGSSSGGKTPFDR